MEWRSRPYPEASQAPGLAGSLVWKWSLRESQEERQISDHSRSRHRAGNPRNTLGPTESQSSLYRAHSDSALTSMVGNLTGPEPEKLEGLAGRARYPHSFPLEPPGHQLWVVSSAKALAAEFLHEEEEGTGGPSQLQRWSDGQSTEASPPLHPHPTHSSHPGQYLALGQKCRQKMEVGSS